MSFTVHFSNPAEKDLKRLPENVHRKVIEILRVFGDNPMAGIRLKQDLKRFWKYDFHANGVSYRIIYDIDLKRKIILPLIVGPRENIYNQARRRLR